MPRISSKRSVRPAKTAKAAPSHGRAARLPMFRIMQIHERLKEGGYPNCQALSDDLEVSSKTVQRDIDFMRERTRHLEPV